MLRILSAYRCAGKPDQGLEPYGSFEAWSAWVRSALVWLDSPDPCLTRSHLESNDPVTTALAAVLPVWHEHCGSQKYTVREVINLCNMTAHAELKDALLDVAANDRKQNDIDPRRLAWWLRKSERRMIDGYRFEKAGEIRGKPQWIVAKV